MHLSTLLQTSPIQHELQRTSPLSLYKTVKVRSARGGRLLPNKERHADPEHLCRPARQPTVRHSFFELSMTSHTTLHRTISFQADARQAPPIAAYNAAMSSGKTGRRRRSSSIIYQEPPESLEQISDQSALPNLNSQWVNAKGGFTIYPA